MLNHLAVCFEDMLEDILETSLQEPEIIMNKALRANLVRANKFWISLVMVEMVTELVEMEAVKRILKRGNSRWKWEGLETVAKVILDVKHDRRMQDVCHKALWNLEFREMN